MRLIKYTFGLSILLLMVSCISYSIVSGPYSERIPRALKAGDMVSVTLTNGVQINEIRVQYVGKDSLMLGHGSKPTAFSEIAQIKKKKYDIVTTIIVWGGIVWILTIFQQTLRLCQIIISSKIIPFTF